MNDTPSAPFTFRDAASAWLRAEQPMIKPSSLVKYRSDLSHHLLPVLGDLPVSDISRDRIRALISDLLTGDAGTFPPRMPLSPKSVLCVLTLFKTILRYTKTELGQEVRDFTGITVRQNRRPLRTFSEEEQRALNRYLLSDPSPTNAGILLGLYLGLRIGEVCALKWEDISLKERTLLVRHTMLRLPDAGAQSGARTRVLLSSPKSQSSYRRIPLPDELCAYLAKLRRPKNAYLLSGCPDVCTEPRTMTNRFRSVMRRLGIRSVTFHTLRHTFATRCMEIGFDVKSLSEILGHANVSITLNRYVHPSMEFKRDNMSRIGKMITR
ncbi:MAG: site-specific integrase [Lachnospiraceae bacterium]|nr:site-specific integrase [Lachnospiraceae bacterium]MBP5254814.1 site-specific integrase [Lachnospiraceae bacterium]